MGVEIGFSHSHLKAVEISADPISVHPVAQFSPRGAVISRALADLGKPSIEWIEEYFSKIIGFRDNFVDNVLQDGYLWVDAVPHYL